MTDLSRLSIVVLHFNTPEILAECLGRLRRYAMGAEVIVVDTGEPQGARALIQQDFPEMKLLCVENFSMAYAVNQGLKRAKGEYLCHMNADVYVEEGSFAGLLAALEGDKVGMVGPLARDSNNRLQNLGLFYRWQYRRLIYSQQKAIAVPWLSGCMQVFKRDLLQELGGLNPSYRFYNEDKEWCLRLRQKGYRCLLVNSPLTHLGGSSTPSAARFSIEGVRGGYLLSLRYYSPFVQWLHRGICLAYLRLLLAFQRQETSREQRLLTMFQENSYLQSPFGASLAEDKG